MLQRLNAYFAHFHHGDACYDHTCQGEHGRDGEHDPLPQRDPLLATLRRGALRGCSCCRAPAPPAELRGLLSERSTTPYPSALLLPLTERSTTPPYPYSPLPLLPLTLTAPSERAAHAS